MNLDRLHEAALHQLTGCRYAVIKALHDELVKTLPLMARGRPIKRTLWAQLVLTLIKLRLDLPYRTIEVMFRLDAVTAYRDVRRILAMFSALALKALKGSALSGFLIVDSTGTRVRSTDLKDHSGHKHHKRRKCQAIVTESGEIVSVSKAFAGSVHDKRIWNDAYGATKAALKQVVLADKAYVGAKGEGEILLRPHRRSDAAYKADKDSAKAFNRALSKGRELAGERRHHSVKVEHVFAQMKHFRVLSNLFPFHPERYGEVFRAVAVIHNFKLKFKQAQHA